MVLRPPALRTEGGWWGEVGGGEEERVQIGMFPQKTGKSKKEEKKGKEKRTNESETMIADLSYRCVMGGQLCSDDSEVKNESNKDLWK